MFQKKNIMKDILYTFSCYSTKLDKVIYNGTPLEKVLADIKSEIKALAKDHDFYADTRRKYGLWIALDIIAKYCRKGRAGMSNKYLDISLKKITDYEVNKVLEDIKSEIQQEYLSEGHYSDYWNGIDKCLEIIDKHCGKENTDESSN